MCDDGTRHRCVHRERFPLCSALKRRANSFTVTLFHEPAGAFCYHVRQVIPRLSGAETETRRLAEFVAAVRVQRQRRAVCGATAENLAVHTVRRTFGLDGLIPDDPWGTLR
ncbi:hypothetical protein HNR23_005111 [Nocardiopsis mwathae]|uniref:Uncharacterized protein n=1 Tax=Nocardiopsis mwathae TaxID=1472723 RepID=A0A7W9YP18_9ACTN|nr:hypothetical protein [Nocardiopsis mwathae]MBB6175051.1 hypothetical protein [Nocardiopsis mwathae]